MDINPEAGYQWGVALLKSYAPRLDYRVDFKGVGTFYLHLRGDPGATGAGLDTCYGGIEGSTAFPHQSTTLPTRQALGAGGPSLLPSTLRVSVW